MKKRRYYAFISLALIVILILVGCNGGGDKKEDTTKATLEPFPTIEPYEPVEGTALEFTVASVFTNDMVVQREIQAAVYGLAPESENGQYVAVEFKGQKASGQIEDGRWKAIFQEAFEASTELGHTMTVSGGEGTEIHFDDVLVGDVWYINGQSNADLRFSPDTRKLYLDDLAKITRDTPIRLFNQLNYDLLAYPELMDSPQDNTLKRYKWTLSSQQFMYDFPMLGLFFGARMVELNPDVPVGLVTVACGGAPLSILTPKEVAQNFPLGMKDKELLINSVAIKDSGVYNVFIHPFVGYGIKGMLFFQGESDTLSSDVYPQALKAYVDDLRIRFRSNFEFLNVQLSSYGYQAGGHTLSGIWDKINDMRNAQAKIKIENILDHYEIISSYDVGWQEGDSDGAHPRYKKPLGDRLANIAAAKIYNIGSMEEAACPLPKEVKFSDTSIEVSFYYTGDKLVTHESDEVKGFEVLYNGVWFKAEARIEGAKIIIDEANAVTAIRYGNALRNINWEGGNVFSEAGNPLICFEIYKD